MTKIENHHILQITIVKSGFFVASFETEVSIALDIVKIDDKTKSIKVFKTPNNKYALAKLDGASTASVSYQL